MHGNRHRATPQCSRTMTMIGRILFPATLVVRVRMEVCQPNYTFLRQCRLEQVVCERSLCGVSQCCRAMVVLHHNLDQSLPCTRRVVLSIFLGLPPSAALVCFALFIRAWPYLLRTYIFIIPAAPLLNPYITNFLFPNKSCRPANTLYKVADRSRSATT